MPQRPAAPIRPIAPPPQQQIPEPIYEEPVEPAQEQWAQGPADPNALYHEQYATTSEDTAIVDDDDAVIVPAPPVEYLGHTHSHHAPARAGAARQPGFYAIEHRRTIIPILFTTGVMMLIFGAARYFVDADSPLGLQGAWISFVLFGFGAISLAACGVSIIQLQQMQAKAKSK